MKEMTNIPEKGGRKRVVIVGGGFAGLKLARRLDRRTFQVVLLDKNNYHQFQPLFYQVATAGLEPSSIAFPFRKVFQKDDDIHFRVCTATGVIPGKKIIETNIGFLEYDYLVIASGCDSNFFGNSDFRESTMPLKTISEALFIRNHIIQSFEKALNTVSEEEVGELLTFVIVGGGPTGVELAGAIAEMRKYILPKDYPELKNKNMKVIIIDAGSKLLGSMSEKASRNARRFTEKLSVDVRLNNTVKGYKNNIVELENGEKIRSANVFWVAGIKGNTLNGIPSGLYTRGTRIAVDSFNRVNEFDGIFAVGDTCYMTEERYPEGHPQVAQVAIQQARTLARNLKNLSRGKSMKQFRYNDKGSMATIGRNLAVADLRFIHIGGFPAWALWLFVHLMSIVGAKNRLFIFLNWMWSYFTFDQSLRLLITTKKEE